MYGILDQLSISHQDVKNSRVYLKIGDDYFLRQNYDRSIEFYDLAIKINPKSFQALINKGKVLTTLNRYFEAHLVLDQAQEQNPLDYQVPLNQGNIYQNMGEYQKAIELYDHALQLNKYNSEIYLKKGDSLLDLEKLEDAQQAYNLGFQFNNAGYEVFIMSGKKFFNRQMYKESIKFYDISIQLKPCFESYKNKHSSLVALVTQLINLGKIEIANQPLDSLEQNLFQWRPCYSVYYKQYGDILIAQGKVEQAINIFNISLKYIKHSKKNAKQYINIGDKFYQHKQYQEALKIYDISIKLDSKVSYIKMLFSIQDIRIKQRKFYNKPVHFLTSIILQLKVDNTLFLGKEFLEYENNSQAFLFFNIISLTNKGDKYFEEKQYGVAIWFYDQLIKLNTLQCYLKKGDTLIALGKIEEAFEMFNKEVLCNQSADEFIYRGQKSQQFLQGDYYSKQKEYILAMFFYELLIKLNPLQCFLKKGDLLIAQGKIEEALNMYIVLLLQEQGLYSFEDQNINHVMYVGTELVRFK